MTITIIILACYLYAVIHHTSAEAKGWTQFTWQDHLESLYFWRWPIAWFIGILKFIVFIGEARKEVKARTKDMDTIFEATHFHYATLVKNGPMKEGDFIRYYELISHLSDTKAEIMKDNLEGGMTFPFAYSSAMQYSER